MNRYLPTSAAPITVVRRLETPPLATTPFRATQETEFERLKDRLLRELLEETVDFDLYAPFRRAANDAAALAWTTQYPMLLFPSLLEEKAAAAKSQAARQKRIRRQTRTLVSGTV